MTDMLESHASFYDGFYVVVLCGTDDSTGIQKNHRRDIRLTGNNDFWRLLPDKLVWGRAQVGPSFFRQGRRYDFSRSTIILNLISDPDRNPKSLRIADQITAKHRNRLINAPRAVARTRRDDIARTLQGVPGFHIPKVLRLRNPTLSRLRKRMEKDGFRFPAIVRRTGTQTGQITGLFRQPEDLADHVDGMTGEYYFTEFVDYRQSDGLFRKMRLFRIGEEVVLNHLFISDHWNIHGHMARRGIMKDREELRAEEKRYFDGVGEAAEVLGRAEHALDEIYQRIKLDYFGVDFGLAESGEFILFEANATMNITTQSSDPVFEYARKGKFERGARALERLLCARAQPIGQPSRASG